MEKRRTWESWYCIIVSVDRGWFGKTCRRCTMSPEMVTKSFDWMWTELGSDFLPSIGGSASLERGVTVCD